MAAVTVSQPALPRTPMMRLVRKRAPIYAGLTVDAILAGLPIYCMIITTFKPDQDLYNLQNFPLFFNRNGVTLDHLRLLFLRTQFVTWAWNTAIVSAGVVAITMALS